METRFVDEFGGELLASVSRSFYLSIRFLTRSLRPPVTLAYLLARASDTIADETSASVQVRLKHLDAFKEAIERGATPEEMLLLRSEIVPAHPGEKILIEKAGRCLDWLATAPAADRSEIVSVLRKIVHGQDLDLRRFGDPARLEALRTPAELDEYTYLVAGCVGEFWTRLCFLHIGNCSSLGIEEMCALGTNFGKGLQLVNILRDLPADLKAGRCYLPADELSELGLSPDSLRNSPRQVRPLLSRWLLTARRHLEDGGRYIESLKNVRIRFACILPWYLGMRTLALLARESPLETDRRIKIRRSEVYAAMALAGCAALSNTVLRGARNSGHFRPQRHRVLQA